MPNHIYSAEYLRELCEKHRTDLAGLARLTGRSLGELEAWASGARHPSEELVKDVSHINTHSFEEERDSIPEGYGSFDGEDDISETEAAKNWFDDAIGAMEDGGD